MMVHVLQEIGLYVHVTLILPVSTSMYLVVIFDSLFAEVICYEDEYHKPIILLPKGLGESRYWKSGLRGKQHKCEPTSNSITGTFDTPHPLCLITLYLDT